MAEAVVSAVLQELLSVVGKEILAGVKLVTGVDDEVRKLTTHFEMLQAVLADAERSQVMEIGVRVWLEKLKDVSYDMDDVLDTWSTAIMKRLQREGSNDAHTLKSKVRSSFLFPYYGLRQVILSHDIASKIKAITKSLDDIAKGKDMFKFKITMTSERHQRVETTSFIDVSDVYGRDEEVNSLVGKLLGESSEQSNLRIISIVGMGGIGKTTLAQLAYNNNGVMKNFEKRIWVCVSNPFDELMIAKAINEALGGDNSGLVNKESVIQKIHELIKGKKFLLVLDDVWTEDFKKWEPFHHCLKNGLYGSKVLVTTRNQTTALMMESSDIITIQELSDEQCWSLFRRFAFFGRSEKECEELEKIGREIVSKCNGLPLTIKVLGSLLRFKKTKKEWENILCSEMWKVEFEEGVFPQLLLSYYDLPSMVQRCFTYCAMFPKDYVFDKDELIRLWMAQGYLGLDNNDEIEMVGEKYFNTLAIRSFFQEFVKDDNGSITSCKMHDTVHDVAQLLNKNICCMIEVKNLKEGNIYALCEKARQLMLMLTENDTLPPCICNFKKLRSLMIIDESGYSDLNMKAFHKVIPKLFKELTSLKVLKMHCNIPISKKIGKLLHLRYLDLGNNYWLKKLPESLCELYNLQTLKLDECASLEMLPQGIGKLINLRHLMNYGTDSLKYMPKGIERLIKLRRLSNFHLNGGAYGDKACSLECMNNFEHIESLGITGLKNSRQVMDQFGQLKNNENISRLGLWFKVGVSYDSDEGLKALDLKDNDEAVIEAFQPPPNLQLLTIWRYDGESMSRLSYMTSLTNLRSISLLTCNKCLHLPSLGKLPSLETLSISMMPRLREVGNEFVGVERDDISSSLLVISFPKLKTLRFERMSAWEVWDFGIEDDTTIMFMPSLHTLNLSCCPILEGLPKQLLEKAPLQNLTIEYCNILEEVYEKGKGDKWHHISHIPNIHIYVEDWTKTYGQIV